MKSSLFLLSILTLPILSSVNLTVKIDNLKNSKGDVIVALYNQDGSIPDEKLNKFYKKKIVPINNKKATVTFKNLKKGKYAVVAIHDENSNSKIDKGLILPLEGVGFSNFNSISLLNKPNFKKASFSVDKSQVKDIKIIYF